MSINNKKILEGLLAKNKLIIKKFVESNFNKLLIFVKSNGGTLEDAEDLMQDALIALYNKVQNNKAEIEKKLNLYFTGMYRKLWFRQISGKAEYLNIYDENISNNAALILDDETPIKIDKKERYKLYKKHYYKLDKLCKQIFKMLNKGATWPEIANELKYRKRYVYKKKSLCKKELLERIMKDPMYKHYSN